VIAAPSLASGGEFVRQALGVVPETGGEHPGMGTHNLLLRLGEAIYLEVIAINPDAPRPNRARWFGLDHLGAGAVPRLATWVARTDDIRSAAASSPLPLGNVESMRRGEWNWLVTIPADGGLPAHGIAPTLIQWPNGLHPASKLQDLGCSLIRLEGFHPEPERIVAVLNAIGFEGEFLVSRLEPGDQPRLAAVIQTRDGVREIG